MENYINYIKAGLLWPADKKGFILLSTGIILFTGPVAFGGFILGGIWKLLAIILLFVYLIANITTFILLCEKTTVKRHLYLQVITTFNWIVGLLLAQTIMTVSYFGFQWWMIISYILPILIPVIAGTINNNGIKNGKLNFKKSLGVCTGVMGGSLGFIVAMLLKDELKNLTQSEVRILMLLLITVLHSSFSIHFLSIQRLYYIHKYNLTDVLSIQE